ncbi:hypothetical protein HJFPF1_02395 [Paramyrothecium foliicola]|nr:hypothetical protein HJFPF1_02395 [Paramyrothecium foliicola]
MHFATITTVLAAALAPQAYANFDIYNSQENNAAGEQTDGWTIFNTDPSCGDVNNAQFYFDKEDVSGTKIGVRCSGNGCWNNQPDQINQLEMHFSNNPLFHWTIYKDRGHP